MRTSYTAGRGLLVPALGLALAATMTACSSSSSSTVAPTASATTSTASTSTPAASTPAASTPAASATPSPTFTGTAATVAKNWVTFMTGTTPTATKVSLLQDGSKFEAVLAASTSASAKAAGATVQSVTITSSTQATVVYTITISGTPMLANQKGTAVLENGVWKVGDSSFCSLAALQSGGKAVPGCPS